MKNQTFAAYRHMPTDKIHILDLDLFQKQTMPDGATSLACEYFNEDGEKAFAVIASDEQDEPGVTYIPLSEKENVEIMEAYVDSEWPQVAICIYTNLPNNSEYLFTVDVDLPEHIIATVEFIEPKINISPSANNLWSPLKLTWDGSQYKVNKPLDQSGEYVDKSIADALLAALIELKEICLIDDPEFNIPDVNVAIDLATARSLIIKPEEKPKRPAIQKGERIILLRGINTNPLSGQRTNSVFSLAKGEVFESIERRPGFMDTLKVYCHKRGLHFTLPMEIIKPAKS